MKAYKFYCLILIFQIVTINFLNAQQENSFRLYNEKTSTISINKQFVENETVPLSADKKEISGLSISGSIKFKSDFGLVRVILEDDAKNEYLVYETYPLLTEGKSLSFENMCEETALLKSVIPSSLKIIVSDAECNLKSVEMSTEKYNKSFDEQNFVKTKNKIMEDQLVTKINAINRHNEKTQIGWYAGVNDMAKLSFSDKKRIFNAGDNFNTQGYEYYVSGFFTIKSKEPMMSLKSTTSSPYVDDFDWRNRHGINWDTSIKHQGNGGSCWAFATVAAAEAYVNLYYNRKLDMDLSEQNIVSCNTGGGSNSGGWPVYATNYIAATGIVNESCFPFADSNVPCANYCIYPTERIKINGSSYVTTSVTNSNFEDELKKTIIAKGPITGVIYVQAPYWHHAMEIVGYGKVKVGDRIRTPQGGYETINAGNPLVAKTYWIYKNSYGLSSGNQGYHYIVYENYSNMGSSNSSSLRYFTDAVESLNLNEADRICEDRDRDGYYFWGIGPKPATCPSCAPNEPDGDDSNPNLGPMDEYGYCAVITPLVENITTSQTWSTNRNICRNVNIQSGVTLTITATTFSSNYTITIKNGGKLVLSGGTIDDGYVIAQSGSELTISNNGKVLLSNYDNLDVQLGAVFNLNYGEVSLKQ